MTALRNINMHVGHGEVLGLIGDNGAGKSTLIKILTGFHQPTRARLFIDGQPVASQSVKQASALGIETVFQDLALVNTLPVYMNLPLNKERDGALPAPPQDADQRPALSRRHRDQHPVGQRRGGQPLRWSAAGDRGRAFGLLQREDPAARRAAVRDGRQGGWDHPRPGPDAARSRRPVDHHHRAQLHPGLDVCDRVNLLQHGEITYDKPRAETSAEDLLDLVAREYRTGGKFAEGRGSYLSRSGTRRTDPPARAEVRQPPAPCGWQ